MRGMTRGQMFELVFWAVFAIGAFTLTFKFNRDIEIYKFGASGWPRAIILFVVAALVGQYFHDRREARRLSEQDSDDSEASGAAGERSIAYYLRIGATLGLPLLYASLLERIGFYTLTPLFIVGFLLLSGERRVKWIIGVTVFLYAVFLLLFATLLYVGLPTGNVHPFYDFSHWLLVNIR